MHHYHGDHLHQDDQVLYDAVRRLNAEIAAGFEERPEKYSLPKGKEKNILLLINSLRLICDHGEQLLPEAVKLRMEKSSIASFASEMQQVYHGRCSVCEGEIDDSIAGADDQDSICVNCATSEQGSSKTNLQADLLGRKSLSASQSASSERSDSAKLCHRPSAKVLALLGNLEQERTAAGAGHRPRKRHVTTPSLQEKITSS